MKLEENCLLQGTGNVQGQMSVHIFLIQLEVIVFIIPQIFFHKASLLWRVGQVSKYQNNSCWYSKIFYSLFITISSVEFSNVFEMKTQHANIKPKF